MFNTSGCNKDFRKWSESIMTRAQELIKKLKETQRDLQWQCDMELHRLESELKKKEEAIDDLNSSLFEMVQINTDKDKQIKALQEEIKWLKTPKVLPVEKTLNVEMLPTVFDIHADIVRQLSEYRARQLENEIIKLPKEFTVKGKIEWIKEPTEEKLEVGKWYHTNDFTIKELKELLPVGTTVLVEQEVAYDDIETKPPTKTILSKVEKITKRNWSEQPLIDIDEITNKEWFKIVEVN